MSLLENHLDQISLSATAIAELPFPPPKIFANALLRNHDITTLIRDTETHERALFSVDPSIPPRRATRRGTVFPGNGEGESMASRIYAARDPRKQSAVARVLGGDMMREIESSSRSGISNAGAMDGKTRGELDIEVLLKGAEKLCNVYPVAGAPERIANIRNRHQQVIDSIAHYEERVARQTAQLERMNRSQGPGQYYDDDVDEPFGGDEKQPEVQVTAEDLQREQEEIRELEMKKKALEERVSGMERDLGGLNR